MPADKPHPEFGNSHLAKAFLERNQNNSQVESCEDGKELRNYGWSGRRIRADEANLNLS